MGTGFDAVLTQTLFDDWASSGRAETMEREHGRPVRKFLGSVDLSGRFLDVGCGNGWVVRHVASLPGCSIAVGIDQSPGMIMNAASRKRHSKERYYVADVQTWKSRRKFDRIFSMEALYYVASPERALCNIVRMLDAGGAFYCGTDYYAENAATLNWPKKMGLGMHLLSRNEWAGLFEAAGLSVKTRHIRDMADRKRWKNRLGTLFITGSK